MLLGGEVGRIEEDQGGAVAPTDQLLSKTEGDLSTTSSVKRSIRSRYRRQESEGRPGTNRKREWFAQSVIPFLETGS